jgi:hypothetical protein
MALPYKIPSVLVTVTGDNEEAIRSVELFIRQRLESTGVIILGDKFPSDLEEELDYNLVVRVKMRARAIAVKALNTSKKTATQPAKKTSKIRLRVKNENKSS